MPPSHRVRAVSPAGAFRVLGLSLVLLTGCLVAPPGEDGEAEDAETMRVSLCFWDSDTLPAEVSLADVRAMKVSIQDDTAPTDLPVDVGLNVDLNVDLLKAPAPDTVWCSSPLPALPLGRRFVFSVSAYSSQSPQPAHFLFSGTATRTLTVHDSRILVTVPFKTTIKPPGFQERCACSSSPPNEP